MIVELLKKLRATGLVSEQVFEAALKTALDISNQARVRTWVREVFTDKEANDVPERALRTAEEALELAQACGIDAATLHRLVDYVMSRPAGKPAQEIAGTMVTLYAMAAALSVDADEEFETELKRIAQPEVIDRCRRRQHEKREALAAPQVTIEELRERGGVTVEELGRHVFEDDRIDSVRYALRDAIEQHIDRCGGIVPVRSLPDETVVVVLLKVLAERGVFLSQFVARTIETPVEDFCDAQLGLGRT